MDLVLFSHYAEVIAPNIDKGGGESRGLLMFSEAVPPISLIITTNTRQLTLIGH